MSNIDKRALREAAERASTDNHTQDEWFHYLRCSTSETVLALLDELEAKDKRLNEILTPNMLLPVIDDMDADNLRHLIKTGSENYSLLYAKWRAAESRIAELSKLLADIQKGRPGGVYFNKWDAQISNVLRAAGTAKGE